MIIIQKGNERVKALFTIDCGEIILREFLTEDAEAIYQLTSQSEVYEFLPDWRSTKEQRSEWLKNYEIPDNKKFIEAIPNITNEFLKLGMILKETNEFIGFCNTGKKKGLMNQIVKLLMLFQNTIETGDIQHKQFKG